MKRSSRVSVSLTQVKQPNVFRAPTEVTKADNSVRVAIITGSFAVIVAMIGFLGTLVHEGKPQQQSTTSQTLSCPDLIKHYVEEMKQTPWLFDTFTNPTSSGAAPINRDPDAQRCGIDKGLLARAAGR